MAKKKPTNGYWNYRVVTKLEKIGNTETRTFGIAECYYNKDDVMDAYSEKKNFYEWDRIDDILGTHKLIGNAFSKPVIDLDNFPNEFKDDKKRIKRQANNS